MGHGKKVLVEGPKLKKLLKRVPAEEQESGMQVKDLTCEQARGGGWAGEVGTGRGN